MDDNVSTSQERKRQLRQEILAARREMPPQEVRDASARVVGNLRGLPELAAARTVHTYLPARSLLELDLQPLIDDLVGSGIRVGVPSVREYAPPSSGLVQERLRHCRLGPDTELVENRWGIREPTECLPFELAAAEIIIVPALACDEMGFRLGFGFAYYDEVLEHASGLSICPCLERFVVDSLPAEEHDRPVDIIVTESSVRRLTRAVE